MTSTTCALMGDGGGGGGPMKFGDPVILADDKAVEHRGAVIHTNDVYPDWVRVLVTDVIHAPAPKIGDDDIPTLTTKLDQYVKIVEKSDKPVAGRWTWRPVPTGIPMGGPATGGPVPKPPKGV